MPSLPTCNLFLKLLTVFFLMLHVSFKLSEVRRKWASFMGNMARLTTKQELIYAPLF